MAHLLRRRRRLRDSRHGRGVLLVLLLVFVFVILILVVILLRRRAGASGVLPAACRARSLMLRLLLLQGASNLEVRAVSPSFLRTAKVGSCTRWCSSMLTEQRTLKCSVYAVFSSGVSLPHSATAWAKMSARAGKPDPDHCLVVHEEAESCTHESRYEQGRIMYCCCFDHRRPPRCCAAPASSPSRNC